MKLKRRICRRVLASLMLLAVSLSCAFNVNAKLNYRGFVEGGIGITVIEGAQGLLGNNTTPAGFSNSNYDGGVAFGYMLATTHGIQLRNNFFGVGLGITPGYCVVGDFYFYNNYNESKSVSLSDPIMSKISIPAYFNWRYDFFGMSSIFKPYVGVKVGLFIPLTEFKLVYEHTPPSNYNMDPYEIWEYSSGSLPFIAIDFGFRKRISETSGMSFGLSIQNSNDAYAWRDYDTYLVDAIGISILAKVAFDF
ncbi:MAG: hypothetical protein K2H46_08900 [Muribaculaceae bacterium]|nr:hypothetical protein [Muribaculaceae bacterium]